MSRGQAGRTCRGAEMTRAGARAAVCPSWGVAPAVSPRVGGLCPLSPAVCSLPCFQQGRKVPGCASPAATPGLGTLSVQPLSAAEPGGRSLSRLITAVNCRSQGRGPAGAPPSLHSLLPPLPERGSGSAAALPRCRSLVHAPLPCPFLRLIPRFHVLFL